MATKRYFTCKRCGRVPMNRRLFDSLLAIAKGSLEKCPKCQGPIQLQLEFGFGLDVTHSEVTVQACYCPKKPEKWKDSKKRSVTFYPFLVITDRHGRDEAAWLPYWHVVDDGKKKSRRYGQWAPFMDMAIFEDLLAQARKDGYLK